MELSNDRDSGRRSPILSIPYLEKGDRYSGVYIPQPHFSKIVYYYKCIKLQEKMRISS